MHFMRSKVKHKSPIKKLRNLLLRILLVLLLLMSLGTLLLSIPVVQTRIARYATTVINETLGTQISIDKVKLSLFTLNTALKGIYIEDYKKDTLVYIRQLNTSILNLKNVTDGKMAFGAMAMEGVYFNMKTYVGAEYTNLDVFVEKLDDRKPRPPGKPPFFMASNHISIVDGRFKLTNENLQRPETLYFTNLELQAEAFQILGSNVSLNIQALAFNTQRGIALQHLSTHFTYTPQQMRFEDLKLNTSKSGITGNLVFNYKREDLREFVDRVALTANFTRSKIALSDVNKFYNEFGANKKMIFSGNASGTLNRLRVKNLKVSSEHTRLYGDFEFTHIFSKLNPFALSADIHALTSNYTQLSSLMPRIVGKNLPSAVHNLGMFTLQGQAEVTPTSLQTHLNVHTAVGMGYAELQMNQLKNIADASYAGFLSLTGFDLGKFTGNTRLGLTSLEVQVAGKGFSAEHLNTKVTGEVHQLEYNNYEYQDLKISGIFKNRLFDGSLESDDKNCRFTFKGLASFGEKEHQFNFNASVAYADLKQLHFINDSISIFQGNVLMNIRGTTLDNMVGNLRFSNTTYQNEKQTYYFEDFAIASGFDQNKVRTVHINSPDIVTGYLKGKFKVKEIGKLVQNSIGSLYTHYKPYTVAPGQHLDFNFKIYNKVVEIFLPKITFDPNTFIRGSLNADQNDFNFAFTSPRITALGNTLNTIELKIDNTNSHLNTFVAVRDIANKYYNLKDFSLVNTAVKDTLFFQAQFKGGTEYNDAYNLNVYHTFTPENKSVVGLKKSDLTFKGSTWVLNKNDNAKNKVIFNRTLDSITIEEVVMDHNNKEQLKLKGQLADSTYKDINLQFSHVSLNKITPAIDSLKLNGLVNGSLNILQKEGKYLPTSNLNIKDFAINTLRLGDLEVNLFGNNDLTRFEVNTWLRDKGEEKMSINGQVTNYNQSQQLNLLANFTNFTLEPFSPLGGTVISNLRGTVNGSAKISGVLSNPAMDGILNLDKAGMGIPYLNVDYNFAPTARVRLSDQTFYFENIQLSDVAEGTTATLKGSISHTRFRNWSLNLDIDTHNNRFMILNTPYREEALYYGRVFINGTGKIHGPTNALTINVDATTAKGTALKIPLRDVTTVGDYSFINFIEKGVSASVKEERVLKDYQGLEMAFDLAVTPEAEVEIVVDRTTGSSLKGTGEGLLLIEINTNGKFNMYGDFVVVTGEYNLKYGGVIDKKFKVRPGGRIVWEREPLKAQLDLEAVYALNANPAPLLDNPGFTGRIPTEVVVRLDGELESPNIRFDIDFPGTNSVVQSELEYRLQDPTIKERNAFSLLAQGTFSSQQTTLDGRQIALGNAIQTASGLLNQILEGDNDKFNLGVSYEQGGLDPNTDVRTGNRIGVTVSTQLSDRVLVNGRVGVPVGGVSETVVAGDVEVQVLLNEKGTLSAKIFNRENQVQQFLAAQQGYIQGVGLSYRVDFNSFRELLQKVLGKKKNNPAPTVPESAPNIMGKDSLIRFTPKY